MDCRSISVPGATLNVATQGDGPDLLFVHGFPFDHRMWTSVADHLAMSHRVIAPDMRGFGASSATEGVVSMEQMADDLFAVLHALDIREPLVLCGLSMGGYVAMQFVKKYADRLRGLILCDTRTGADPPEVKRSRETLADSITDEDVETLADAMIPKLFSRQSIETSAACVESVRTMIMAQTSTGIAAAARGMALRDDTTELLRTVPCPSLVVVGEEDLPSPPYEMQGIADKLHDATFVEIEGAGHMTPLEKPDVFNTAIETFLTMIRD